MNARNTLTVILVAAGLILALLPLPGKLSFRNTPKEVLHTLASDSSVLTPDEVAKMIVKEEPGFILVDVRSEDEFREVSIPGSVSLPYKSFSGKDPGLILPPDPVKKVFYSNSETDAGFAAALAAGYGHKNVAVMKGGLNGWFTDIMESTFSGEKISARENALFETRFRARRLFTEINSLPDSLKAARLAANKFDPKKLDGGCE